MNLRWKSLDRWSDFGLLVMRVGVGTLFVCVHGWPRLAGGPRKWHAVGGAMSYLGIDFAPALWGFLASLAMTLGGALLVVGYAHRPAALGLFLTMTVAAVWKYYPFGGWDAAAHAAAMAAVALGLVFTGPGKHSLDAGG